MKLKRATPESQGPCEGPGEHRSRKVVEPGSEVDEGCPERGHHCGEGPSRKYLVVGLAKTKGTRGEEQGFGGSE